MCQFLHVTPMQLGEIRHKDPAGVAFIEKHFIHRKEEEHKHYKEMERKSKAKKSKHR